MNLRQYDGSKDLEIVVERHLAYRPAQTWTMQYARLTSMLPMWTACDLAAGVTHHHSCSHVPQRSYRCRRRRW